MRISIYVCIYVWRYVYTHRHTYISIWHIGLLKLRVYNIINVYCKWNLQNVRVYLSSFTRTVSTFKRYFRLNLIHGFLRAPFILINPIRHASQVFFSMYIKYFYGYYIRLFAGLYYIIYIYIYTYLLATRSDSWDEWQ